MRRGAAWAAYHMMLIVTNVITTVDTYRGDGYTGTCDFLYLAHHVLIAVGTSLPLKKGNKASAVEAYIKHCVLLKKLAGHASVIQADNIS